MSCDERVGPGGGHFVVRLSQSCFSPYPSDSSVQAIDGCLAPTLWTRVRIPHFPDRGSSRRLLLTPPRFSADLLPMPFLWQRRVEGFERPSSPVPCGGHFRMLMLREKTLKTFALIKDPYTWSNMKPNNTPALNTNHSHEGAIRILNTLPEVNVQTQTYQRAIDAKLK